MKHNFSDSLLVIVTSANVRKTFKRFSEARRLLFNSVLTINDVNLNNCCLVIKLNSCYMEINYIFACLVSYINWQKSPSPSLPLLACASSGDSQIYFHPAVRFWF